MLARERAELAREMHDVTSHQVSLMAVRARAWQVGSQVRFTDQSVLGPKPLTSGLKPLVIARREQPRKRPVQRSRDAVDRCPDRRIVDNATEIRHLQLLQSVRQHQRLVTRELDRDLAVGPGHTSAVDRTVRELTGRDVPVTVPGRSWGRALALHGPGGLHGYLVVTSGSRPTHAQHFLLATLVRLTAAALSVAVAHRRQREDALELHRLRRERATLQRRLIAVVVELGYQRAVHEALAEVAAAGGGEEAITSTLHELTGLRRQLRRDRRIPRDPPQHAPPPAPAHP
ncbi:hypothetical protein FHS41_007400 [Streptomyces violarus]|uniref:Signal transduction histidine kinase subgroup 3 dimerisation and phosphoacceptor domain-containing protein n=1 Tax=Streptomyces violarus TaxID=67380 RepID=A0A7W4ZY74_9ACTN|nr:hypothetical protein [Streptomyces violarus]